LDWSCLSCCAFNKHSYTQSVINTKVRGNGIRTMRHLIVLVFLLAAQFSCRSGDSKVMVDNLSNQKSNSDNSDSTLRGHPFKFYIDHKQIPQVCKDLFINVRQPTDEADVLSLLDSIFTTNNETRPFYFFTITRTMSMADGAYAEPLGMMAKQFVETRTNDFVEYFKDERILTNTDFEEWAKTVAGEIQIAFDGQETDEAERLMSKMKSNCIKCDIGQIKLIDDFVERVRYHCP